MPGPDLYTYLDYRKFLRDWFTARKAGNPRFSHRSFARRARQSSPSLLLHVIEGKRNLTPATTEGFTAAMGLAGEEAEFFSALVAFDQADTLEARNKAWERVRATRRFREARRLDGEAVEYLSHWYYPAIRELAACVGFRGDPEWIAAHLMPRVSVAEARQALQVLRSLGLLTEGDGGVLVPAEASVATPHEVVGLAGINYHIGMVDRAREAIQRVPHQERHFCALTVAIPAALIPRLKREMDAFQERMLDLCDGADLPPERVYQINLQVFPLSGPTMEEGS